MSTNLYQETNVEIKEIIQAKPLMHVFFDCTNSEDLDTHFSCP